VENSVSVVHPAHSAVITDRVSLLGRA